MCTRCHFREKCSFNIPTQFPAVLLWQALTACGYFSQSSSLIYGIHIQPMSAFSPNSSSSLQRSKALSQQSQFRSGRLIIQMGWRSLTSFTVKKPVAVWTYTKRTSVLACGFARVFARSKSLRFCFLRVESALLIFLSGFMTQQTLD